MLVWNVFVLCGGQELAGNWMVQYIDWDACSHVVPGEKYVTYRTQKQKEILLRPGGPAASCMHADVVVLDLRDAAVKVLFCTPQLNKHKHLFVKAFVCLVV